MTIAILSALAQEQDGLAHGLSEPQRSTHAGRACWRGRWHGHDVVLALAGVGKVAAATTATALIERFGVQRLVFTGVAGGLGDGVRVGDVVVADSFLQHDMDASPLFPRFQVPLYGRERFATDAALSAALAQVATGLCANPALCLDAATRQEMGLHTVRLHRGLVLSGDQFIASAARANALRADHADALAVEMEGAAVAQVCADYQLPFAAVRTVSDRADDSAHLDFPRFIDQVASRYALFLMDGLLRQLPL